MEAIWIVVLDIFYFHPYLGEWSNLTHIFQRGWNHHLVTLYLVIRLLKGFYGFPLNRIHRAYRIPPFLRRGCRFVPYIYIYIFGKKAMDGTYVYLFVFQGLALIQGQKATTLLGTLNLGWCTFFRSQVFCWFHSSSPRNPRALTCHWNRIAPEVPPTANREVKTTATG